MTSLGGLICLRPFHLTLPEEPHIIGMVNPPSSNRACDFPAYGFPMFFKTRLELIPNSHCWHFVKPLPIVQRPVCKSGVSRLPVSVPIPLAQTRE